MKKYLLITMLALILVVFLVGCIGDINNDILIGQEGYLYETFIASYDYEVLLEAVFELAAGGYEFQMKHFDAETLFTIQEGTRIVVANSMYHQLSGEHLVEILLPDGHFDGRRIGEKVWTFRRIVELSVSPNNVD